MSFIRPKFRHPNAPQNELGLTKADYEGAISTLCAGCGHDSISAAIMQACFELALEPHKVAKISGIGCSSKMPTYFLGQSHGFNSVHGRMPSVATGANLANRDLVYVGVSGDGDTASIGMGQFMHVIRRNLNMLYIVANNGCYGLTKGQDSATSDLGAENKQGMVNQFQGLDLASLALQAGATLVARSFSGDKAQLVPLIKAAIIHKGFAFIDVISPCVTFNNHTNSTKSYEFIRKNNESTPLDFVPMREEIRTSYKEGCSTEVCLHDGSVLRLHKTNQNFDLHNRQSALNAIAEYKSQGSFLTGLMYIDVESHDLHTTLNTIPQPLNQLSEQALCPGNQLLESINNGLR